MGTPARPAAGRTSTVRRSGQHGGGLTRNGGSRSRRSRTVGRVLAIDHVIVVVHDLDAAACRFDEQHGLASVAAGVRRVSGTGNRIGACRSRRASWPSSTPTRAGLQPARRVVGTATRRGRRRRFRGALLRAPTTSRRPPDEPGASRSRCVAPRPRRRRARMDLVARCRADRRPPVLHLCGTSTTPTTWATRSPSTAACRTASPGWSWAVIPTTRAVAVEHDFCDPSRAQRACTGSPSRSPSALHRRFAEGRDLLVRHHAAGEVLRTDSVAEQPSRYQTPAQPRTGQPMPIRFPSLSRNQAARSPVAPDDG